jgi:hypothetical protein
LALSLLSGGIEMAQQKQMKTYRVTLRVVFSDESVITYSIVLEAYSANQADMFVHAQLLPVGFYEATTVEVSEALFVVFAEEKV